MKATWKEWKFDDCIDCGDTLEVKTSNPKEGHVYDSDEVRCVTCGYVGTMRVSEDSIAYVSFDHKRLGNG